MTSKQSLGYRATLLACQKRQNRSLRGRISFCLLLLIRSGLLRHLARARLDRMVLRHTIKIRILHRLFLAFTQTKSIPTTGKALLRCSHLVFRMSLQLVTTYSSVSFTSGWLGGMTKNTRRPQKQRREKVVSRVTSAGTMRIGLATSYGSDVLNLIRLVGN
ncbi:hypothetical protein K435DRAFT_384930 [Dendrothele bispora CBS 962.96]|uniref:Uncharacterized protein n=1 Tax=Dendrothele bispora (strain CBS 962.96) TaxID=1314807 RepID=A0A4S8LA25_DENBC|nr:hypothetical protein K435DRAFT_384930 [Dendrothele bispora CBS 962.96]